MPLPDQLAPKGESDTGGERDGGGVARVDDGHDDRQAENREGLLKQ